MRYNHEAAKGLKNLSLIVNFASADGLKLRRQQLEGGEHKSLGGRRQRRGGKTTTKKSQRNREPYVGAKNAKRWTAVRAGDGYGRYIASGTEKVRHAHIKKWTRGFRKFKHPMRTKVRWPVGVQDTSELKMVREKGRAERFRKSDMQLISQIQGKGGARNTRGKHLRQGSTELQNEGDGGSRSKGPKDDEIYRQG